SLQRNRPEDVGLPPIDDPVASGAFDEPVAASAGLSRDAWINLLLIGGFYFFDKFIRYALWSWGQFFLNRTYGLGAGEAAAFSTAFGLARLPGGLLTRRLADRYLASQAGGVCLAIDAAP